MTAGYPGGEQDSGNREPGFDYDAYCMAGVDYFAASHAIVFAAITQ